MTKRKLRIKNSKLKPIFIALLFLGASLFLFLQFTKPALAGWWPGTSGGTNWAKRQQLNLTNNSSDSLASTTTVAVTVDTKTLVATGKLRPDCNDLRIVYQPTSSTYTELTRHITYPGDLSCSTSEAAKVYFSLQSSIAATTTDSNYYLYYGNQQAEAPTSTDNAFDIGSANATLVCPFDGSTTCAAAETNTAGTPGAIRYSGSKSAIWFSGIDSAYATSIDYVTSSSSSVDNLLVGDTTIEFWIYWQDDGTTNSDGLISKLGGSTGWYIYANKPTKNISVNAYYAGTDLRFDTASNTLTMNAWHHVAVTYIAISKSAKVYVDGTEASYTTRTVGTSGYSDESANDLYVGKTAGNVLNHMRGAMDELRISNVLRYTANFTPQTTPFTSDSHTKLLYHFDDNGGYSTSNIVNDDTSNNAYGVANNCSYVSGLVGVDSTNPDTGYMQGNNAYSGHAGTLIEEATTNKITNPSFENGTYNLNWTAAANLTVTQNTSTEFVKFGSNSAKIVNTPVTSLHYSNYNSLDRLYYDTTQKRISQGFQVGSNTSIYSAVLYSYRSGTDSGSNHYYRVEVQTDNSGVPSNTPVTNGTSSCVYHNNLVNATDSFATFTFSSPPSVSTSTQYHLVLKSFTDSGCTTERTSADTSIYLRWLNDNSSPAYTNGQRALMSEAGTWTSSSSIDSIFALYDESDSPAYTTTIDPNSTATHTLSAYVFLPPDQYTYRQTMNSREIQLVWEGVAQSSTTYNLIGGGWWRISYQAATTDASNTYGIYVGPDVTAYVDGFQLEENNLLTSYTDGSLGTGYAWTSTANASTSTRTISTITYPTSGNISNTAGSISMWVKMPQASASYPSSSYDYFFATQEDVSGDSFVIRYSRYTNVWDFVKYLNFSTTAVSVADTTTAGEWVHIAATWSNSAGISLQINGGTAATNANTTMPDGFGTSIYIGNNFSNSEYHMQGMVSDLRIFNTALSTAELNDIYYSGLLAHSKGSIVDRFSADKGSNPVAIYHFDESTGSTAADSSTYRNDLTVYSGATWNTQSLGAANNLTRNLKLDGSTGIASRSADVDFSFGTSSFTASTWFRHSSTISGTDTLLADYGSAGWKVYMNSSGFMCFGIDDDSTYGPDDSACSSTSYADSKWHHLEAVKNGTTSLTLYIDGTRIAVTPSLTATGSLNSVSGFFVGADTDHSNHWDGWIDELVLFTEARTADQAKTDFQGIQTGVSYASQASDPLSNGLVAYWKMDESSGTLTDLSGNGYTGTWGGTGSHYGAGKYGKGAVFNGTNDVVTTNVPSDIVGVGTTSYSMAAWIYAASPVQNYQYPTILGGQTTVGGCGSLYGLGVTIEGMGVVEGIGFSVPPDPSGACYASSGVADTNVNENEWHHYTGVFDAKTRQITLYKDGKNIGSDTWATSGNIEWDPGTYFNIGGGFGNFFPGNMDEARVYTRALSPTEVTQLYNFAPGPVGYWKLDENTGISAYDASGNNQTGTLVNSPEWVSGRLGNAVKFNGNNESIQIDDSAVLSPTNAMTVELWAKSSSLSTSDRIISKFYNSIAQHSWTMHLSGVDNTQLFVCIASTLADDCENDGYTSTGFWEANVWHHLTFVFDGSQSTNSTRLKLYKDGNYVPFGGFQGTIPASIQDSTVPITIGNMYSGTSGNSFNGNIDDVKIYNYARTPGQIVEDMNASHPAPGSPVGSPYLDWDFDEGYSTVLHDTGSTGTHTGATNATWTASGKNGKALTYNGTSHYSNTSSALDLSGVNTMSVSFWLNWDAYANDDDLALESSTNFNSNDGGIIIDPNSGTPCSGSVQVAYNNQSTAGYRAECMSRPSAGVWHHWAITFNYTASGDIRIYIDGVEQVTSVYNENNVSSPAGNFGNYSWYFMSRAGSSLFGAGKMDNFRIYTFELTPDQVKTEYNSGMSQVMGSLSTSSTGVASNSSTDSYCPPGQSTTCVGPIAEWKFDENTGSSAYDTSGNSNTATFQNDTKWSTGKTGAAAKFDGSTDYISVASSSFYQMSTNFSYEAWVMRTSDESVEKDIFMTQDNWIDFYLRNFHDINVRVRYTDWTGDTLGCSTWTDGIAPLNTWTHYAVTMDSSVLRLYINGKQCNSLTVTKTIGPGTPAFIIGAYQAGGLYSMNGLIDNLTVYNYARTPAQIAWDINHGAPVAQYDFDECSGNTLHDTAPKNDRSSTSYNGTINPGDNSGDNDTVGTCNSGTTTEMWNDGTSGKYSGSLGFDGTNDYVDFTSGDVNVENWTAISFSSWFYISSLPNNDHYIISKSDTMDQGFGSTSFRMFLNSSGTLTAQVQPYNDYNLETVSAPTNLTTGRWYHAVCTWNGSEINLYLNGNHVAKEQTDTSYITNTQTLFIGRASVNPTSTYFSGLIDDVRIYSYPLTSTQVKNLYNQDSAVKF
jgi:hypothetical protein